MCLRPRMRGAENPYSMVSTLAYGLCNLAVVETMGHLTPMPLLLPPPGSWNAKIYNLQAPLQLAFSELVALKYDLKGRIDSETIPILLGLSYCDQGCNSVSWHWHMCLQLYFDQINPLCCSFFILGTERQRSDWISKSSLSLVRIMWISVFYLR
jgi:hypothetical protein